MLSFRLPVGPVCVPLPHSHLCYVCPPLLSIPFLTFPAPITFSAAYTAWPQRGHPSDPPTFWAILEALGLVGRWDWPLWKGGRTLLGLREQEGRGKGCGKANPNQFWGAWQGGVEPHELGAGRGWAARSGCGDVSHQALTPLRRWEQTWASCQLRGMPRTWEAP